MADIAHPIHQPQTLVAQPRAREMILDDHGAGRNPPCLANEESWFLCVVKYVHQHDDIVRTISEWQNQAIELPNGNCRVRTRADFDARGFEPGPALRNRASEATV